MFFVRLERLCESQLVADAAGEPLKLSEEEIEKVFRAYGGEEEALFQAEELYEWIDHETGGDYKV